MEESSIVTVNTHSLINNTIQPLNWLHFFQDVDDGFSAKDVA